MHGYSAANQTPIARLLNELVLEENKGRYQVHCKDIQRTSIPSQVVPSPENPCLHVQT